MQPEFTRLRTHRRKVTHRNSCRALKEIFEGHAHKRRRVVDVHLAPRQHRTSGIRAQSCGNSLTDHRHREFTDERLDERHHGAIVTERFVHLHRRELWIVAAINAFIAKVAIDLIDLAHAANQTTLEIELRRNAHKQRHIKGIVMRGKRARCCTTRKWLQHRRFNFEEIAAIHESTNARDTPRAHSEDLGRFRIRIHIDIATPIAQFRIRHSMPLLRRRREALAPNVNTRCPNAHFALLRPTNRTFREQNVAVIRGFRQLPLVRFHCGLRHAHLNVTRCVTQRHKHQLPHVAMLHDASCDLRARSTINDHCCCASRRISRCMRHCLRRLARCIKGNMRLFAKQRACLRTTQQAILATTVWLESKFIAKALEFRAARRNDVGL